MSRNTAPPDSQSMVASATKNGYHHPSLAGTTVSYVMSALVKAVYVRLRDAYDQAGIVVVTGANGMGKSTASRLACDRLAKLTGCRVIWVEATPPRQSTKLTVILANELGVEIDWGRMWWTAYLVGVELEKQKNLLVAVDEGGYLAQEALGMLRGWHDLGRATWTLMLVGNDTLEKKLQRQQPELLSRTDRYLVAREMPQARSVTFAKKLHVDFDSTDRALLVAANTAWVDGTPRRWAQLLAACLRARQATVEAANSDDDSDLDADDHVEAVSLIGFDADTVEAALKAVRR